MRNKNVILALIITLVIIGIGLTILMINLLNGNFRFSFPYKTSSELVLQETYGMNFETITIDSKASDISIKNSDKEDIEVLIYGTLENTFVEEKDKELEIVTREKECIGFCFRNTIAKVIVYLPKQYQNNISIKNKFGDIEIEDFSLANINIEEDCGDVNIYAGKDISIKNNYGDITIHKGNKVTIDEKAGDIKMDEIEEAILNNAYGDITIEKVGKSVNIKEDCGDVELSQLNLSESSKIENSFGDITIGSTNEIYIDAKTDLGDIKINNNYNKSDIQLKIENSCGDIRVKN